MTELDKIMLEDDRDAFISKFDEIQTFDVIEFTEKIIRYGAAQCLTEYSLGKNKKYLPSEVIDHLIYNTNDVDPFYIELLMSTVSYSVKKYYDDEFGELAVKLIRSNSNKYFADLVTYMKLDGSTMYNNMSLMKHALHYENIDVITFLAYKFGGFEDLESDSVVCYCLINNLHPRVLGRVLCFGCNPNRSYNGHTSFYYARKTSHKKANIELLLMAGLYINRLEDGISIIKDDITFSYIQLFLKYGLNPRIRVPNGSILLQSIINNDMEVFTLILELNIQFSVLEIINSLIEHDRDELGVILFTYGQMIPPQIFYNLMKSKLTQTKLTVYIFGKLSVF